jgi:hypothetical protein
VGASNRQSRGVSSFLNLSKRKGGKEHAARECPDCVGPAVRGLEGGGGGGGGGGMLSCTTFEVW